MTDEAEPRLLAQFCAELAQLRSLFRGPASAAQRAVVEQAVRAARRSEPIGPWLAQLRGETSGSTGSEAPPPLSVPPTRSVPPRRIPVRVPDVDLPPVTGIYLCPREVCSRVEVRRAGSEVPRCDIHEQALRFVADS